MTLAAVMPTLRPSIWPLSWAARSSQRSARAGEAPDTVSATAASSASAAASTVDLRNCGFNVIVNAPFAPLKRPPTVRARVGALVSKPLGFDARDKRGHDQLIHSLVA